MPKITMADLEANPPKLTPQERAAWDALSEDDIERLAASDPDNPPWTDEDLARASFARMVRETREALDLTQAAFAQRYEIKLARLKDWERGRYRTDSVAAAYIKAIRHDPKSVAHALQKAS